MLSYGLWWVLATMPQNLDRASAIFIRSSRYVMSIEIVVLHPHEYFLEPLVLYITERLP